MHSGPASTSPSCCLGIECGGTRTVALLVDEYGGVVRRIQAGPANLRLMSDAGLARHFKQLARSLTGGVKSGKSGRRAGAVLHRSRAIRPAALGIGMAGVLTQSDRRRVRDAAAKAWPGVPCWAGNDLETALTVAGLPDEEAATVVVISGTGSCAYGQNRRGVSVKAGGWGHILGDRGSGYDISLRALREVMRRYDQTGQWPRLGERIFGRLLLNRPSDLVAWAQAANKANLAALAVIVFEACATGDPIARAVVNQAASMLAEDALACARRLCGARERVRFALTGSVLVKQPAFARKVARLIQIGWPVAVVRRQHLEGAWGAVRQAQAFGFAGKPCRGAGEHPPVAQEDGGCRESDWGFNVIPEPTGTSPTELRNPRSKRLDRMTVEQAVRVMIAEEAGVRRALAGCRRQIAQGVRMIVSAFRGGGRLFYAGAGTSGRLGVLDASECPPTFRTPPEMVQGIMAGGQTALWLPAEGAEDDLEAGAETARFRGMREGDVVVGIAASGRTPFVWGVLHAAKRQGARTILLSFNPHLRFEREMRPDLVISPSVGPEVLTGSTRLKAGTATKLMLNMFTTLSMVQLGKVVQNLMVDLNPSNTKLRDRAARILKDLTGRGYAECLQALERSGWVVKKGFELLRRKRVMTAHRKPPRRA